jgi:predicted glycoside hydrolase/deacetylase ChbG (UPF0249 family)
MRPRRIIVNADDFGMSAETNRAIVEGFASGVISSTTVMANMPGFEEACQLALLHRLNGKIGVHLNLTEGRPLTQPIRSLPRLCNERGMFRPRRTLFRLSKQERRAVETEFAAQIQACMERGIVPTHLDSHQHIHTEWPIGRVAIRVARRYGIGAIRLTRNCGPGIGWAHRLYKAAFNGRLRLYGLAKTRYFGSAADVQAVLTATREDVEVMVHLSAADAGKIPLPGPGVQKLPWAMPGQLTSYA